MKSDAKMWDNSHMEDEGLIARNVRLRMEAMDLNPKTLSLKAGLNETYVRDLLKGRSRNPRQAHLQNLALALGCRVSDLTGENQLIHSDATAPDQVHADLLAVIAAMDDRQRLALLSVSKVMMPPQDEVEKVNTVLPSKRRPAA